MEKTYRSIVLVGLLIGLIVNGVATYHLRADVADLDTRLSSVSQAMTSSDARMTASLNKVESNTTTQFAEHERLITQLENMMNYQLDQ